MEKHKLPGTVIAIGLVSDNPEVLWVSTLCYGLLISLYADERERGTAFGWYHLAVGLSAIPVGALVLHFWSLEPEC